MQGLKISKAKYAINKKYMNKKEYLFFYFMPMLSMLKTNIVKIQKVVVKYFQGQSA